MRFIPIDEDNIEYLNEFIDSMGSSSESFRYYDTREPENVISDHIVTILLFDNGAVGYGHLDREEDIIWLGICVKEGERGRGYGRIIMEELTRDYDGEITLTVDKDNVRAIKLYRDFSFDQVDDKGSMIKMVRKAK